ncbi:MAG: polysaccharide pyruvyl transferase family protein [Ilumatobacteraceae bacterium]
MRRDEEEGYDGAGYGRDPPAVSPTTKVVAIGDVGSTRPFHVGDEAMLQSVIEHARTVGQRISWCVVSADPAATERLMSTAAVPGVPLGSSVDSRREALADWDDLLALPPDQWADSASDGCAPLAHELATADALLIAGGGNLSNSWPGLVVARLALVRAARRRGIPIVVTGQSLGPVFGVEDHPMVAEILLSADVVGVRERASWFVALEMGVPAERLVLQVDDALALELVQPSASLAADGFIAVTFNHFDSQLPAGARAAVASQLRALSERTGTTLVYVPHLGPIDSPTDDVFDDVEDDLAVARSMCPDGHIIVPVPTPAEAAWFAARAEMVVSSRYHPIAMATAHGTPALFISQDGYTAIKGIGALEHVGLAGWSMPADAAADGLLAPALAELWDRRAEVRSHIAKSPSLVQRSRAHLTWILDRLCRISGGISAEGSLDPLAIPTSLDPVGGWVMDARVAASTGPARISHHRTTAGRHEAEMWRVRFTAAEIWTADLLKAIERKDVALRVAGAALEVATRSDGHGRAGITSHADDIARLEERFASAERWALDLAATLERKDAELRVAGAALEVAADRLAQGGFGLPDGGPGSTTSPPQHRRGELVLGDLRTDAAGSMAAVSMSIRSVFDGIDGRLVLRGAGDESDVDGSSTPFLPISLLLATRLGLDLVIDGEVDAQALVGGRAAVRLWSSWFGTRVPAVRVSGRLIPRGTSPARGIFFSRGLDSMDALLRRREEIEHLVGIDWEDGPLSTEGTRAVWRGTEAAASALDMPLIRTSTNAREFLDPVMGWSDAFGSVLASISLVLRPRLGQVWISSTFPDRFQSPHSSHPDLDPLWSSADVTISHDWDGGGRTDKARRVADVPLAMDWLKVCWERAGDGNCGRCAKCLMTMTNFHLAGRADAAAGHFGGTLSPEAVRLLAAAPNVGVGNIEDLLSQLDSSTEMYRAWHAVLDAARRTSAPGWG